MTPEFRFGIWESLSIVPGPPQYCGIVQQLLDAVGTNRDNPWPVYLRPKFEPIAESGVSMVVIAQPWGQGCSRFPGGDYDYDLKPDASGVIHKHWRWRQSFEAYAEASLVPELVPLLNTDSLAEALNTLPPSVEVIPYMGPPADSLRRLRPDTRRTQIREALSPWLNVWVQRTGDDPKVKRMIRDGMGIDQDATAHAIDGECMEAGIHLGVEPFNFGDCPWGDRLSLTTRQNILGDDKGNPGRGWPKVSGPCLFLDTDAQTDVEAIANGVEAALHGMVPLFSAGTIRDAGITAVSWTERVQQAAKAGGAA